MEAEKGDNSRSHTTGAVSLESRDSAATRRSRAQTPKMVAPAVDSWYTYCGQRSKKPENVPKTMSDGRGPSNEAVLKRFQGEINLTNFVRPPRESLKPTFRGLVR
jgi:hypothetical protein